MKLDREEIIKALECHANGCKCGKCPMSKRTKEHHSCWTELSQGALALIKELKAELLRIVEEDIPERCTKEILNINSAAIMKQAYDIAVRKFARYLKEHSFMCDPGNGYSFDAIDVEELDDYVQEFLEEN